jgi:hypothetical protein
LTTIAAADAADAGLVRVTAPVVGKVVSVVLALSLFLSLFLSLSLGSPLRSSHFGAADRPRAARAADRVVQIWLACLEQDFDKAIFTATLAAQWLALALEAARRFRRARLAVPTLLPLFLLAAAFAALAAGRNFIACQIPEDQPQYCAVERGQRAAARTRST